MNEHDAVQYLIDTVLTSQGICPRFYYSKHSSIKVSVMKIVSPTLQILSRQVGCYKEVLARFR